MTERPLTLQQRNCLETLKRLTAEGGGVSPSIREIGAAMGLRSSSTVQNHVNVLIRKGYLIGAEGQKTRSLRLADVTGRCPVCGSVTA